MIPYNVSFSSSGDNTIIAANERQSIRLFAIALTAASPVTITVKDGASITLGAFQGVTSLVLDPFAACPASHERWTLTRGNALIFNLSSGVSVTGTIWAMQE